MTLVGRLLESVGISVSANSGGREMYYSGDTIERSIGPLFAGRSGAEMVIEGR